jgi:hypothetical protein
MTEQSRLHAHLNWAKQRIDEMDATLASLETTLSAVKADSRAKASQLIADMKKQRDEFQAKARSQAQAAESALQPLQAQLDSCWRGFEAQLKAYFAGVVEQIEHQQTAFLAIATAHAKSWRESADTFQREAAKVAAAKRADLDAAIKEMKAEAAQAETRFNKLKQAGSESWAALSTALATSRSAFDRANRQAGDALKGTGSDQSASST